MAWGLVISAGIGLIGSSMSGGGNSGASSSGAQSGTSVYDPYAPYRGAAATKLNNLMADPSSIQGLPEYQADMQAASRTMASQGYTGSGNALVAAANAGGQAYQQAFNNLAMLSGAGANPAYAQSMANRQANNQQGQSNQMWGQLGSAFGNWFGGRGGTGGGAGGGYTPGVNGGMGTYGSPVNTGNYMSPGGSNYTFSSGGGGYGGYS